jgi:hypothetical protein
MLAAMRDDRLAQAADRVHELARSLVASAAAARRELAALEGALTGAVGAGGDWALSADLDAARLVAIELADAGSGRDEVARHLRGTFGGLPGASVDGVLADVFG